MPQSSSLTRFAPIGLHAQFHVHGLSIPSTASTAGFAFGHLLNSPNGYPSEAFGDPGLADLTVESIWNSNYETPSPTAQRARSLWPPVTPEPVRRVESTCDIVHPRPKTFWVLVQRSVVNMEAQVAFEAKQKEQEIRTQAIAAGQIFDRSDDDEIVVLPKRRSYHGHAAGSISPPRAQRYSYPPHPAYV